MALPAPAHGHKHDGHTARSKRCLSPDRRRLLELMQWLNFGRIERLLVVGGEPVLQPLPSHVREVKFGASNRARPELALSDFVLKAEVRELFDELTAIGDGIIEVLVVKHGVPFSMELRRDATETA